VSATSSSTPKQPVTSWAHTHLMSATDVDQPVQSANVRLVLLDEQHQPRYLSLAADLERAILRLLATADMTADDVPGLHGLLINAARAAVGRER